MANFESTVRTALSGDVPSLSTGDVRLDMAINKIQQKTSYGIAAAPKVGKTKATDFFFVLSPFLDALKRDILDDVEWIYWSFEIDRITKEFEYAAFFMALDYNIYNFSFEGELYSIDAQYLQGKKVIKIDESTTKTIPLQAEHASLLKPIYLNRIIPLFGQWTVDNKQVSKGKITFIEHKDNPTGMWKLLLAHAKANGTIVIDKYQTLDDNNRIIHKERTVGYTPNNPRKFTICITDHVRKLGEERNFTLKQRIDKWAEYSTEIRNLYGYTFIHVIHSNRQVANVDRLRFAGEYIFPTGDDTKDSGNLSEECTVFMTLFNPNDEKYNLSRHFGVELKDYPLYRSLHIVEARNVPCPVCIQYNMLGGVNMFTPLMY